jgi:hypothetical protein
MNENLVKLIVRVFDALWAKSDSGEITLFTKLLADSKG